MDEGTALEQHAQMRYQLAGEAMSTVVQQEDGNYAILVTPLRFNNGSIVVALRSPRDVEVFQETAWLCAYLWT